MPRGKKTQEKMVIIQTTVPESLSLLCKNMAAREYVYPAVIYRRLIMSSPELRGKK